LNEESPVLGQIYNQNNALKRDKDKCNMYKYELADKICKTITKANLSSLFPSLQELISNIKSKIIDE
jgi:predicted nucleotide-binding protein (sugar kinase/HSP70/actin superfamily)